MAQTASIYKSVPDENGHFGIYGGRYVSETLMPLILSVEQAWNTARNDPAFWAESICWHAIISAVPRRSILRNEPPTILVARRSGLNAMN